MGLVVDIEADAGMDRNELLELRFGRGFRVEGLFELFDAVSHMTAAALTLLGDLEGEVLLEARVAVAESSWDEDGGGWTGRRSSTRLSVWSWSS